MNNKTSVIELQDVIETIGIHCDKAKTVLWQISEDYFNKSEPNLFDLEHSYQMYSMLTCIVDDYLFEIQKMVNAVIGGVE